MTRFGVLHVARAPYTGVWALMRQLSRWQIEQGYTVGIGLLLPPAWPAPYREQLAEMEALGCIVYSVQSPALFGTAAYLYHQLRNPISEWARHFQNRFGRSSVVHCHDAWLSGAYGPLRAPIAGFIATYHGIQGQRVLRKQPVRRAIHGYWARRLVAHGAKLVSVDPATPHTAEQLFGVPASLFTVVRNGVAAPSDVPTGRSRLRDRSRPFTVGHVGVVDDGKGWRVTGAAIEMLRIKGLDIHYLIAGSGPDQSEVTAWCRGRQGWARYLGSVRDPSREVFPQLDLMALPSLSEGMPMAVIEALAQGIPVLATPVGGLLDSIQDDVNGFLITRDPASLAERIETIAEDEAALERLSHGARATHAERFSTELMGRAYEAVYFSGTKSTAASSPPLCDGAAERRARADRLSDAERRV